MYISPYTSGRYYNFDKFPKADDNTSRKHFLLGGAGGEPPTIKQCVKSQVNAYSRHSLSKLLFLDFKKISEHAKFDANAPKNGSGRAKLVTKDREDKSAHIAIGRND